MYKIVFYQDKNGRREVEEYLKRISSSKQLNDKRTRDLVFINLNY